MDLPKIKLGRENLILVGILVIALVIPLTVILLGVRQELRKRAEVEDQGSILINNGNEVTNSRDVTLTLTTPTLSQSSLELGHELLEIHQAYAQTGDCCYSEGIRGSCPGTPFAVCENGVDYFCCKFTPGGWAWHKRIDHPCGTLGPCLSFGACILYEYLPPGWEGQTWGCCDPETDQWLPESNCTGKYYAAGNCTCDGTGNCVPTPTPTPTPTPRPPTPTPTPPVILLNCNEACVSRGFASGYCDSAAVYPGEFLCESGETNIGWTKDCYVEQGILGIKKGCCCQPTPAPTPEEILMMISNYEDFRDASPEPFSSMRSWTLTEGDGLKTVWAKFKVNGVWTEPVFDTIILDTSEPEVTLDLVKVWFKQQEKALGKGHEGAVLLYLKQGGSIVSEKAVQLDENGEARDVELPGVTAGTYDAFIYEPGYLTKKLANVEMKESGNTLDFTKGGTEYFLVGDFNGDQVVNILDFSIFVESYDKSGEE